MVRFHNKVDPNVKGKSLRSGKLSARKEGNSRDKKRPEEKKTKPRKCSLCEGKHYEFYCEVYSSARARKERLKAQNRCVKCATPISGHGFCTRRMRPCKFCEEHWKKAKKSDKALHKRWLCPIRFKEEGNKTSSDTSNKGDDKMEDLNMKLDLLKLDTLSIESVKEEPESNQQVADPLPSPSGLVVVQERARPPASPLVNQSNFIATWNLPENLPTSSGRLPLRLSLPSPPPRRRKFRFCPIL